MKQKLIFVFGICLLFLVSCTRQEDDCATVFPKQPVTAISIVDTNGNSLIGEDNIYKPSEISLSNGSDQVPLEFYESREVTRISFYFNFMTSEKDYFLKLNETETDTINLTIRTYSTKCFGMMQEIEKFRINGVEIQSHESVYVIQK